MIKNLIHIITHVSKTGSIHSYTILKTRSSESMFDISSAQLTMVKISQHFVTFTHCYGEGGRERTLGILLNKNSMRVIIHAPEPVQFIPTSFQKPVQRRWVKV